MGSDIAFGVGVPWLDGHFHMTVGAAAGITCKFHAPKCRSNGIETANRAFAVARLPARVGGRALAGACLLLRCRYPHTRPTHARLRVPLVHFREARRSEEARAAPLDASSVARAARGASGASCAAGCARRARHHATAAAQRALARRQARRSVLRPFALGGVGVPSRLWGCPCEHRTCADS